MRALAILAFSAAVAVAQPPPSLQQQIDAAIASGQTSYSLTPGALYAIGPLTLSLFNATGFTLNGNGATLSFYPGFGLLVDSSSSSSVTNLTLVYDPPCFTQGAIVAADSTAHTVDVLLDAGFPAPDAALTPYFASAEVKLQFWDPATRLRLPNQPGACIVDLLGSVGNGVWRVRERTNFGLFFPPVGTLATISPRIAAAEYEIPDYYRGQSLSVLGSSDILVEDVTVTGSGNFAVLEWGGAGGHTFRRFSLARRDNVTLLSSNTDGFHSFSTGTGATIVDSTFHFHGDDAMNFHNRILIVLDAPPAAGGTATFIDVGDVPSMSGGDDLPLRAFADAAGGDTVRVFSPAAAERGAFSITSVASVTDPSTLARARAVAANLPGVTVNPNGVAVWAVGLAAGASLGSVAAGDLVQFDRRASAGALIVNSTFEDSYDSCIRLQASNTALVSNTFARNGGGITVVYDPGWLEGSAGIQNVTIAGNSFTAIGNPPATSMGQILDVGAGVENVTSTGNTVQA
jgi:hypothetical protein